MIQNIKSQSYEKRLMGEKWIIPLVSERVWILKTLENLKSDSDCSIRSLTE
jgi:hypothetical protein